MNNPLAVCLDRNPFQTVDELVEACARAGFDRLEWFEIIEPVWTTPPVAGHIRQLMRRHELTPQYHAPYDGPFDLAREGDAWRSPQRVAEVLRQCLERAETLGARLMTAHLGTCPPGAERAEGLRCIMEGVRLVIPDLERRRIRLALENHTRAVIADPLGDRLAEFDWLMENLPSEWVGRTLDTGHAHINGHTDEFLSAPLDRIFNFHLHDNHGMSDEHLPLGEGNSPVDKVLSLISRACYRGPLTLEFFGTPEQYARSISIIRNAR